MDREQQKRLNLSCDNSPVIVTNLELNCTFDLNLQISCKATKNILSHTKSQLFYSKRKEIFTSKISLPTLLFLQCTLIRNVL